MNNHLESNNPKIDFFLGDLEQRASERNTMLAVYEQSKLMYGIRPNSITLDQLTNTGEVVVNGVHLTFNKDDGRATINGSHVKVNPLFQGRENSTDFNYNKQRKIYLEDTMKFQAQYIDFDAKGVTDAFGNNHNSSFNQKKVADALAELEPDHENINPNDFFKTEMTATQKIRLMSSQIDTDKAELKKISHKLADAEKRAIKQPLVDKQLAQSVEDILSGAINPMEAANRDKTHVIDPDHKYVQTVLKGIEGINDTKNFAISHLKPMPKDYKTQQMVWRDATAIEYGDNDSNISIIAKQLTAFQALNDIITNAPVVDFSNGTDPDRLFVSTKRLAGAELIDGKSCVMDANEHYRNVNSGDFGLPRSSLLNKPMNKYKGLAITIGASAAGSVSNALKHRDDILVIDALRESNVNQVLFDIRANHNLPIAVFTSNQDLDDHLKTSRDQKLTSNLSRDESWGEAGLKAIQDNDFDRFARNIESRVDATLALASNQPVQPRPSIRPSLDVDILSTLKNSPNQPNHNNHRNQMGM